MEAAIKKIISFAIAIVAIWAPARACASENVSLKADSVKFYGDRYLLEADGNVRVDLGSDVHVTGNTFSMDLRLNRLVVAGNVDVSGPSMQPMHGAGFADFFDTRKIYFIPTQSEPDRWTIIDKDFAHPQKQLEMPGDPFFLPDVSDSRVTVASTSAVIEPLTYVRFRPARVLQLGVLVPVPSYAINFAPTPDFRQNSLAGALADAPYDFYGSAHTLSTMHFRYDQKSGGYAAFEQHYVAPGGYAVASVNPFTKTIKQYNVIGLGRIGPHDQIYGFAQGIATQNGFSKPLEFPGFVSLQLTHVLPHSFLQLSLNQNYQSLLAQPSTFYKPGLYYYYGDPTHAWVPNHPFNGLLTWQGMDHTIGKLPVSYRLRSSFGWAHDNSYVYYSYGLLTFDNQIYNSINFHTVGATIYSKPIKLKHDVYLNFSFDKQRQNFSLPHYIDSDYTIASLSKVFGTKLAVYAGYTVQHTGDVYGAKQNLMYPGGTYVSPVTGKTYDFNAFRGLATYRSLYASTVYAPNPNFTFNLLVKENKDFPGPIPGVLGNPPWQATGDVRFRISPHAVVDVARTYNFNYPGAAWSPNFIIQVLPQ